IGHACPHIPQCFGSRLVLTHVPSQSVKNPHVHAPLKQTIVGLHAVSHAPQCSWLVKVFTQIPLQYDSPPGQSQLPATHVLPQEQTFPHPPQCMLSDAMSTHAPEQSMRSSGQTGMHSACEHPCVAP